jgi:SPOR domain
MVVFAGGLYFAYVQGTRHAPVGAQSGDGVPLLRADTRPDKVKPDQPGGMAIPDQNVSLYNDKPSAAPVEKLLPAAEQPMPRPVAPPKEAAPPQVAAGSPPAPDSAAAPASAPAITMPPAASSPAPAKTAAKAPTKPAAANPVAKTGSVQVRLGSLRSPEAAREEWQRLKRDNSDLIGSMHANAVRTDLGDKGIYYRIEAGPLDAAAAERLCAALKQRNHGCILAR